jgi:hypothetical protein
MPPDKIAVANCRPESKSLFAGSPKSETTRGNKIAGAFVAGAFVAGAFVAGAFVAGAFDGEPRRPRDMQPPRKRCAAKTVTTERRFAAANNTNA